MPIEVTPDNVCVTVGEEEYTDETHTAKIDNINFNDPNKLSLEISLEPDEDESEEVTISIDIPLTEDLMDRITKRVITKYNEQKKLFNGER